MLSGLEARAAAIGAATAARAREDGAAMLRAALPGCGVSVEGETIVVTGRGLADDPRLRWIGSLWR